MEVVANMVNSVSITLGVLLNPYKRAPKIGLLAEAGLDASNETDSSSGDSDLFYEVEASTADEENDFQFDLDLERQAVVYNLKQLGSPFKSFDSLSINRSQAAEKYGYALKSLKGSYGYDLYSTQDRDEILLANSNIRIKLR